MFFIKNLCLNIAWYCFMEYNQTAHSTISLKKRHYFKVEKNDSIKLSANIGIN